jgi:hypothetical protein
VVIGGLKSLGVYLLYSALLMIQSTEASDIPAKRGTTSLTLQVALSVDATLSSKWHVLAYKYWSITSGANCSRFTTVVNSFVSRSPPSVVLRYLLGVIVRLIAIGGRKGAETPPSIPGKFPRLVQNSRGLENENTTSTSLSQDTLKRRDSTISLKCKQLRPPIVSFILF